jgi:hypothetical protein
VPCTPAGAEYAVNDDFSLGEDFFRDADLYQHAVMIAEPQPVAFEAGRRREPFDVQDR